MYARVNTFEGSPESMDDGMIDVREQVLPACEQIPGFAGLVVLVDRSTGRSLGITFWESEAAMQASEDAASTIRTDAAKRQDERIVSVERFEVPVATLQSRVAAA